MSDELELLHIEEKNKFRTTRTTVRKGGCLRCGVIDITILHVEGSELAKDLYYGFEMPGICMRCLSEGFYRFDKGERTEKS